MLRISISKPAGGSVTLRLEGQISGDWIAELRAACEPSLAAGRPLTLDLTGVSLIDRAGFAFLDSLSHHGVAFAGCSPFQAEQLRQIQAPYSTTPAL